MMFRCCYLLGGYRAGDAGGEPLRPGGAGGGDDGCGVHRAQGTGQGPGHHLQESQTLTTCTLHPTKALQGRVHAAYVHTDIELNQVQCKVEKVCCVCVVASCHNIICHFILQEI